MRKPAPPLACRAGELVAGQDSDHRRASFRWAWKRIEQVVTATSIPSRVSFLRSRAIAGAPPCTEPTGWPNRRRRPFKNPTAFLHLIRR
jgi:hypothetical protein